MAHITAPLVIVNGRTERLQSADTLSIASSLRVGGSTAAIDTLTVDGKMDLKEEASSPSATANYGKLYVKSSNNHLYFMDDQGNETDLVNPGSSSANDNPLFAQIFGW